MSALVALVEAADASDEEYFALARRHAPEDLLRMGELSAEFMSGGSPTITRVSDSGNIILRWKENDEAIFFLGMVSRADRLSRADVKDAREWRRYFTDRIRSGLVLLTSPNEKSTPFVDRLVRDLEREGLSVERIDAGGNVMLRAVP